MNARSIVAGLAELKRPYQRNALIGFGISAALNIAIACTALMFCSKSVEPNKIDSGGVHGLPQVIHLNPTPPRIADQHSQTIRGQSAKPKIGIPKPVPDSQVFEDPVVLTQSQLTDLNPVTPVESIGVGISINPDSFASILPSLDTFIAVESQPVPIDLVQPVYPDLARRAGVEGKIWLRVLIDKDGKMREVRVDKSTNHNAGFEEAAIDAAWKSVWKPAIANGLPVSVPVSYAVEFKLK